MLEIRLTKARGALRLDVDFASRRGLVTALFGRSGAGKSSILQMVAGLLRPDGGRIVVDGRVLFDAAAGIDLPAHERGIGYVFQDSRLFPHYSVRGNLAYGMERVPAEQRRISLDQVVEVLGIGPLLSRRPASLSGGEAQRVAIGRALLCSPRLLLLDEPLASLDGPRKAELLSFIGRLPGEFRIPILYVSHSVDEVLALADDMVLLEGGRQLAWDSVETVMGLAVFGEVAGMGGLASVIDATVLGHDEAERATRLGFCGGAISLPLLAAPPGSHLRLRIEASDVILARNVPEGLSVRNVFPARIADLRAGEGLVDVVLDLGCPLHAEITLQASRDLRLAVGETVFALIKSASISRGHMAGHPPLP